LCNMADFITEIQILSILRLKSQIVWDTQKMVLKLNRSDFEQWNARF